MTRWISKLTSWKIGGLVWWKALAMVAVGTLMAWGMSLRYGDASTAWIAVLAVFVFAVCLLWWSHVRLSDDSGEEQDDDRQST